MAIDASASQMGDPLAVCFLHIIAPIEQQPYHSELGLVAHPKARAPGDARLARDRGSSRTDVADSVQGGLEADGAAEVWGSRMNGVVVNRTL